MPDLVQSVLVLARIWERRTSPHFADHQIVLELTENLSSDPTTPPALLSFAWCTLAALAGHLHWPTPTGPTIARAAAAAEATARASERILDQLTRHLADVTGRVLLLGDLASSRRLLGAWDVLPAEGLVIVPLDEQKNGFDSGTILRAHNGIRFATRGRLADIPDEDLMAADVRGRAVLLPPTAVIAARAAPRAALGDPGAVLLLTLSLRRLALIRRWRGARTVAQRLGVGRSLDAAVVSSGLARALALPVPVTARLVALLGRLNSQSPQPHPAS